MNNAAITDKVFELISTELEVDKATLTLETRFKEDLGCDSFDLLSLVTAFEDEFARTLDDDSLQHIVTVGDAVRAVQQSL